MAQAPSMPVFVDALLGDTLHLSAEEFGAYCLLLFAIWRNNGQPLDDDDEELARICRIPLPQWRRRTRAKLARFFDLSDGTWRQGRLEHEWDFVQNRARVSRINGRGGGRPRRNPAGIPTGIPDETQQDTQWGGQTESPQPQPQSHTKNLSQPALGVSDSRAREDPARQAGRQADFEICDDWIAEAATERAGQGLPPVDLAEQACKLIERWRTDPPKDRHAAWIGWALIARPDRSNGTARPNGSDPSPLSAEQAQWAARCRSYAKGHRWQPTWGPPPGEQGCWAPLEFSEPAARARRQTAAAGAA